MSVSKLILGTVQLGIPYGINNSLGQPSIQESFKILESAKKLNVSMLDTASVYGNSEEVIGRYKQQVGHGFSIITKFHLNAQQSVEELVFSSLRKLQISALDTVMYHSFQDFRSHPDTIDELRELRNQGVIDKIGVSVYTNDEIDKVLKIKDISVVQAPFNLLDNLNKRGPIFKKAYDEGKMVHVRSVFLQGLFFKPLNQFASVHAPLVPYLKQLHRISQERQISMGHMALQYALRQPHISGVLFGVESVDQLETCIDWATQELPTSVFEIVDKINVLEQERLNPSNWS